MSLLVFLKFYPYYFTTCQMEMMEMILTQLAQHIGAELIITCRRLDHL